MRKSSLYHVSDIELFKDKLIAWSSQFERSSVLLGNTDSDQGLYLNYDLLVGVECLSEISPKSNSFTTLQDYYHEKKDWLFGFFSYDLKNELENLQSNCVDEIKFPTLHFFQPKWVFEIKNNQVNIFFPYNFSHKKVKQLFNDIMSFKYDYGESKKSIIKARISKEIYFQKINDIKKHIQQGDIYEMNFCQEFYVEDANIDPLLTFEKLNSISDSPFSAYYRLDNKYLICASPERFMKKSGRKIISQPIKGTRGRGANIVEDNFLKQQLINCPKERAENLMIVDLVRNDLSRTAAKSSVKVEELCGVYSFKQVHQMISTITSNLKKGMTGIDAIQSSFPMGSMTGAPKIRAMELIEKYEQTKRGLYSGSVGYFTPEGDFDFNVVIRSILFDATKKYASFIVGSAITANSNIEQEYEECIVKAKAIFEILKND